jgi:hypothetical protein
MKDDDAQPGPGFDCGPGERYPGDRFMTSLLARTEKDKAEMLELLRELEHIRQPEAPFSRCPICGSPNDMSEPHEYRCKLAALLARFPR